MIIESSLNPENSNVNQIYIYSFTLNREFSFLSFLTEFSDKFTSNWNTQEIYGRMDPIYTYKNTIRKISLGFDVPSLDLQDSKINSVNADTLISALYPVYNEKGAGTSQNGLGVAILSSPPFVRIKFANLITNAANTNNSQNARESGLLGWIDGFTFKPELESGFFIEENKLYPKLYKVSFTFNVLHEHALGYVVKSSGAHVPRVTFQKAGANPFSHLYSVPSSGDAKRNIAAPDVPTPPLPVFSGPSAPPDPPPGAGTVLLPQPNNSTAAALQDYSTRDYTGLLQSDYVTRR